jgi:hypothetical protein
VAVADFDGNGRQDVAVANSGDGTVTTLLQSTVSLSTFSLSFGKQAVGTTSPAKTVTLFNAGLSTLHISSISTSGDFILQSNGCGTTLASGASCKLSVVFHPTVAGTRKGGLFIADDALGSPLRKRDIACLVALDKSEGCVKGQPRRGKGSDAPCTCFLIYSLPLLAISATGPVGTGFRLGLARRRGRAHCASSLPRKSRHRDRHARHSRLDRLTSNPRSLDWSARRRLVTRLPDSPSCCLVQIYCRLRTLL